MAITSTSKIHTAFSQFDVNYHVFGNASRISFSKGDTSTENILVRLQSSCLFSESLHTDDCDCELQLSKSMELISREGCGVIVYAYEEGRGIGMENKIKALELERTEKIDTVEAFMRLGFEPDPRSYEFAVKTLEDLKVNRKVRLITNNPRKQKGLEKGGFIVTERVSLDYPLSDRLKKYLRVKKEKLGHIIDGSLLE